MLLGTVILAGIVNLVIEFTTQPKEELLPCIYRKQCPKENNNMLSNSSSTKLAQDTIKEPVDELFKGHNSSGQNPIFIVYGGRRPSSLSGDSLDTNKPSTNNLSSLVCNINGHRPSLDSNLVSEDERLTSRNSRSALFVVSSNITLSSLDPVREYEDNRNHPLIINDFHRASIQRSPSYLTALNNIVTIDDVSHC